MSLTGTHKQQAQKKLRELAEEQQFEKQTKEKIKNISKQLNQKLKELSESDAKMVKETLTTLNSQTLSKILISLQSKLEHLNDSQENLKALKEKYNREKMNHMDNKVKYENSIQQIKQTIIKIQKAVDESVAEQQGKRNKIQTDLDKSIVEIKEKIETFEKESEEFDKQNAELRGKKEELMGKLTGLQNQFKSKAQEKDQSVKKQKQDLMEELKKVQDQVNEVTELNKEFAAIEKKNFDNKLSIYLRTKKFTDLINSFENSATTIDKCKKELTRGVHRLKKAIDTTKQCEEKCKEINEEFLKKFKIQSEKEEMIKKVKAEKQEIRERIIKLQNLKKKNKQQTEKQEQA